MNNSAGSEGPGGSDESKPERRDSGSGRPQRGGRDSRPPQGGRDGGGRGAPRRDNGGAQKRDGDRRDAPRRDGDRREGGYSSGGRSGGAPRAGSSGGYQGRSGNGDRPRYDNDRPRRDGDRPRYEGDRPRYDRSGAGARGDDRPRYDRPRQDGDRPRNDRPRQDGDRPRYDKPRQDGDRPRYDRPRQDGDRPRYDRPRQDGDRPRYDKPRDGGGNERRSYPERGGRPDRAGAPRTGGNREGGRGGSDRGYSSDRPQRGGGRSDDRGLWTRDGRPARNDKDAPRYERELTEEERHAKELRMVRNRHDDPLIPDDVKPDELDRVARNELKTLTKENAEGVARHLVMVARLIEENPEEAHQHAISAARRAGRIAVVRETLAITAYQTGDFALALRELRTFRRISGSDSQIALMVDSERGLGRPERALELGRSVSREALPAAEQVSLSIAMSGARLDLGDAEQALVELEIPQLDRTKAFSYSPDLFSAYAEVLTELGRDSEAESWFALAEAAAEALAEAEDDGSIEVFEEDAPEGDVDSEVVAEAGVEAEAEEGTDGTVR